MKIALTSFLCFSFVFCLIVFKFRNTHIYVIRKLHVGLKIWSLLYTRHRVISSIYYIDISILPKNRQLVFSICNYIRDTSAIFSISSIVKISLTSFLCFSSFFYFRNTHIYLYNKKKITRWLEHTKFIFSRKKKIHSFAARTRGNIFSTRR